MTGFEGVDWGTYVRKRNQDRYEQGDELTELENVDNVLLDEIEEAPEEEAEPEPEAERPADAPASAAPEAGSQPTAAEAAPIDGAQPAAAEAA